MSQEWAAAYEAPVSLDAGRLLGARPMRATIWTFLAIVGLLLVVIPGVMLVILEFVIKQDQNENLAQTLALTIDILLVPVVIWCLFCAVMVTDWAGRPAEHWFKVWLRHRLIPQKFIEPRILDKYHVSVRVRNSSLVDEQDIPRMVVEVSTINLRMTDEEILGSHIKKLHAFYVSLRFPIQIVIRAWTLPDGIITRRWFIAVMAPTDELLHNRITDIIAGLKRAGLSGRALNGDLFDSLQACWTHNYIGHSPGVRLGPTTIKRNRTYVEIDGEFVRGFVLAKIPRIVDANWMHPLSCLSMSACGLIQSPMSMN